MKIIWYLFISMRPKQWTKNLVLFAGVLFRGGESEGGSKAAMGDGDTGVCAGGNGITGPS